MLEEASVKKTASKKVVPDIQQKQILVKSSVDARFATKSEPQADDRKKSAGTTGDGLNKVSTSTRISSPVKQREYRHPDGRKMIIPEAVGVPVQQENLYVGAQIQVLDFPLTSSNHGKDDNGLVRTEGGFIENSVRETLSRSSD